MRERLVGLAERCERLPVLGRRPSPEALAQLEVVDLAWMVEHDGFWPEVWPDRHAAAFDALHRELLRRELHGEWAAVAPRLVLSPGEAFWSSLRSLRADEPAPADLLRAHEAVDTHALQLVVDGAGMELLLGSPQPVFLPLVELLEAGCWLAGVADDGRLRVWDGAFRLRPG